MPSIAEGRGFAIGAPKTGEFRRRVAQHFDDVRPRMAARALTAPGLRPYRMYPAISQSNRSEREPLAPDPIRSSRRRYRCSLCGAKLRGQFDRLMPTPPVHRPHFRRLGGLAWPRRTSGARADAPLCLPRFGAI
eukprot:scaffold94_cov254-Pinguiococcus_pyrenoidosus.AAC.11